MPSQDEKPNQQTRQPPTTTPTRKAPQGPARQEARTQANPTEGIRDMRRPACFEHQKPKLARPSRLGESRQFNDVVAMDAVTWTHESGQNFPFYHI